MIDRSKLLSDLQKLLQRLEADLLERSESTEVPEVGKTLREEYDRARKAERTAQNYEDWRSDYMTQAAAAWVLSCVFVRFLEDNRLIDPPWIAGPEERLARARDEHELYFRTHPKQTDREYLLAAFDQLAKLPGTKDVFGEHNPVRELPNWLSGDAAGELLKFFQKVDANSGGLLHDFTDPNWDTRFLGDLYQDLSEAARKKYALLQTPEFVEEFILDRTLDPALDEFGLVVHSPTSEPNSKDKGKRTNDNYFKMIDPACGSGHFLLGTFPRILDRWQRKEPGTNVRELVQRTLDSIHGVDINPYAVGIARFRLLLAAMRACDIQRLADVPAFRINLVCGDSLLHGSPGGDQKVLSFHELAHVYRSEEILDLRRILRFGQYHAVTANPPYIAPADKLLNRAYRDRFKSCHGKYQLVVPFLERIFGLCVQPTSRGKVGGFVGTIVGNAFMKAAFGKKLIREYFPRWNITHVIDSSGAYIPGHGNPDGTPTAILFATSASPIKRTVRMAMGLKSEPGVPDTLDEGKVWKAIVDQLDHPGTQNEFIGVADLSRDLLHCHPWSVGGNGIAELKELLDEHAVQTLRQVTEEIGFVAITGEDEVFAGDYASAKRLKLPMSSLRPFVKGDCIRDWCTVFDEVTIFPYDANLNACLETKIGDYLWPYRLPLSNTMYYGKTKSERGLKWWEYVIFLRKKYQVPYSIGFAFTATHNHFSFDQGGNVFKQTAPVIKLSPEVSPDLHLSLLGVLNSSTVCFWMRQVCFPRGGYSAGKWEERFNFNNTSLGPLPLPPTSDEVAILSKQMQQLVGELALAQPQLDVVNALAHNKRADRAIERWRDIISQMIGLQEELDWRCYRLYGLVEEDLTQPKPPSLILGQRAFEIALARNIAAGETQTTWFERHGSTPITELPAEWPDDYRQLVERRIALIQSDPNIRLIEQPEYKRRWNTESWESQLERALREWLLNRLEGYFDFDGRMSEGSQQSVGSDQPTQPKVGVRSRIVEGTLVSVAKLVDIARQDADFLQVGELYRDDAAFDVQALVSELVAAESVPLLPVLRYKPSGLIKRGTWERTWDLQRQEDAIDARTTLPSTDPQYLSATAAGELKQQQVGQIPVPTKYDSKDFLDSNFWRLRGKLDVPKERWISFPHCDGPDGTPVIAWAGYDHLQQAQAISAYYVRVQTEFGGSDDPRLIPLLACLIELLPWLKQWHNEPHAAFDGLRMGDYFDGFISEEARQLGKTVAEIKAWQPPAKIGRRGKK